MNIIGKPFALQTYRINGRKIIVYTILATDEVPKQYIELDTGEVRQFRGGLAVTANAYAGRYNNPIAAFIVNGSPVCYDLAAFAWPIYDRQAEQNIIDCMLNDKLRQQWTIMPIDNLINISVFQNATKLRFKSINTGPYLEAQPPTYAPIDISDHLTLHRVASNLHRSILCRTPAGYRVIWSPLALLTDRLWPFVKQVVQQQSTSNVQLEHFESKLFSVMLGRFNYFMSVFEHPYFQAGMTPAEMERANAFKWIDRGIGY